MTQSSSQSITRKILVGVLSFIILTGVFFTGYASGQSSSLQSQQINNIINQDEGRPDTVDFGVFWKAWSLVNEKYVATHGPATTTDQDKVYGAIKGMVDALGDPYTTFFPPSENKAFQTQIQGNFEGIGMEMGVKDGYLTVISALPGTPAKNAGILSGDKLIKIDDKATDNLSIDEAVNLIRGPKGTSVTLTFMRDNVKDPVVIKVVRDVINLPTLDSSFDPKTNIFTVKLYSFSADSASLFRDAMRKFVSSKSDKLILDLRGNPGGYLDAAVDIAGWFLPPGKVVVQEDYGSGKPITQDTTHGVNIFGDNVKVVILIDQGSASASEILAGALSEYGKAKLVGTRSFGKGSVQELINLTPDTSLKVTIARWLTPQGKSISNGGLTPDVEVKMTADDVTNGKDPQMDKAIELLTK